MYDSEGEYCVLYESGKEFEKIPAPDEKFVLCKYRQEAGKKKLQKNCFVYVKNKPDLITAHYCDIYESSDDEIYNSP